MQRFCTLVLTLLLPVATVNAQVEPLVEADVPADRSTFSNDYVRSQEMATVDVSIAMCGTARDPVLRANFMTILNAQSDGGAADTQAVAAAVSNYDGYYDRIARMQRPGREGQKQRYCQSFNVEQGYADFQRLQTEWIDLIAEGATPQAAEASANTTSEATAVEKNPTPAASQEREHTAFCKDFTATATREEYRCVAAGSRGCGVITERITEAAQKCACRGHYGADHICVSR